MTRLWLLLAMAPAQAGAIELTFPLDCVLGETCHIQQFMDRDPSAAFTDFTCGPLAYDGHSGTDFALPTLRAMEAGVTVRAAAAGTVKGVRDGMPDISIRDPAAPALAGRDCGNGLVIDHGDGWETQYCHMAKTSLRHQAGDRVAVGEALGRVGLSGNTEFPHLHLSVRKDGKEIDPFDPDGATGCGEGPDAPLWSPAVGYTPGGIIGTGFSDHIPEWEAIKAGLENPPLTTTSPALVIWASLFGTRAGDQLAFVLAGPDQQLLEERVTLDRTQAQSFRAVGKRLRQPNWSAGNYDGTITLFRGDAAIDTATISFTLR